MLQLVQSGVARTPKNILICNLELELSVYLERSMQVRWPRLAIKRVASHTDVLRYEQIDLVLCACVPPIEIEVPVLWLGEIDRPHDVIKISDALWKIATPVTGTRVMRAIENMLHNASRF